MRINTDLSRPVLVEASTLAWVASPMPGVDRKPLFREGGEIARATSIVRYSPGSAFSRHTHDGGEEIYVLDGVFEDEHGEYPAGSYFRNPPGTSHTPRSVPGCTLFVRLWQFRRSDRRPCVRLPGAIADGRPLFEDGHECVRLQAWPADAAVSIPNDRGLELLLTSGELQADARTVSAGSWWRIPAGHLFQAKAGQGGARFWIREAPLLHADVCPMA